MYPTTVLSLGALHDDDDGGDGGDNYDGDGGSCGDDDCCTSMVETDMVVPMRTSIREIEQTTTDCSMMMMITD